MSEQMKPEVNVEKIMEEIREKIRTEGKYDDIPSFDDIPIVLPDNSLEFSDELNWKHLIDSVDYVVTKNDISYYWDFYGNRIKVFVQRLIRKTVKCIIYPILEKQNKFNAHVARSINNLYYGLEEHVYKQKDMTVDENTMREEIEALKRRIEDLERIIKTDS